MNRRQVLKSWVSFTVGYTIANGNAWGSDWTRLQLETSEYFSITINGIPVVVNWAAANYSYANFDVTQPVEIVITALKPEFWKNGVEILPSRHGIRPVVKGNNIFFTMKHAEKIALSRPGDYNANAPLLFLFGNVPSSLRPDSNKKNVRYYRPGVYHEDIHFKSDETVYLDKGAVVYGSLNFWDSANAHVYGGGVVIHDSTQNPDTDEGWQHRPDWHGITGHNAHNISVKDITVIVRSRTWMIQLQGCKDVLFENIKVIGGTRGNANQDGIDWLGCGDTVVRNCFFRCSDDIFAIYGNTGFYDDTVSIPGSDVENILIEECVLSTSISNILRVSWPRKVFNSRNVRLINCDVIHAGQGSCVVPFALAEFWADPDGKGLHSDYLFDDIRMDNVYSLAQLLQSKNGSGNVKNIRFRNIRLSTPYLVNAAITGNCSEISFENIKICDHTVESLSSLGLPSGLSATTINIPQPPNADFQYNHGLLKKGQEIKFEARVPANNGLILSYAWNFGDGFTAAGAVVSHVFKDANGTRMDGTGQFQVMLTITNHDGVKDTIVRPVVIGESLHPASKIDAKQNRLHYRKFSGTKASWAELQQQTANEMNVSHNVKETALSSKAPYTLWYDGYLEVPVSGGYTIYMMSRDGAYLQIDTAVLLDSNTTKPQVCNSIGNTVQQHTCTAVLEAGLHQISFGYKQDLGSEVFAFYWQGPANKLEQIPKERFFRSI